MRKMFWTAAVLVLAAAPVSAQQAEKTSFAPAAVEAAPAVQPQAEAKEKAPSVHVSRQQLDEAVRAQEERRAALTLDRNFWYLVGAVALGVIVASIVLN